MDLLKKVKIIFITITYNFIILYFYDFALIFNFVATEIQNIQIAEGDIPRNFEIPMHMIFPRQFTCPSLVARTFKVDFEVNLVLMFPDGRLITEKFPIKLIRA